MLKIYVESITKNIAVFKNDKIENHLESVENILVAVKNITGEKPWRVAGGVNGKLVIELSMSDENIEKIEEVVCPS